MARPVDRDVTLVTMTCPSCGIVYCLPESYQQSKRNHGGSWYCPNGHSLSYDNVRRSEQDKLRDELGRVKGNRDYYEKRAAENYEEIGAQKRRVAAQKGVTTKLKNRIAHGVCPCCTRHFDNLERHIATKHPEYKPAPCNSEG